jgi:HAD superfamily hydrolase (TIGR01509 family)
MEPLDGRPVQLNQTGGEAMSELRGVILDVDGTLVDSNEAHAKSWVQAFARFGYRVEAERMRRLIGKGGDKIICEITGLDDVHGVGLEIGEVRRRLFLEAFLPGLRAFPGVRELLQRMRQDGLELVVASSAAESELEPLLRVAGVTDLVGERTSSDDAESSKPDPDIVQAAVQRSGLAPAELLMLGDTPYDVEAAAKAGVQVVALRCGGWDDEGLAGAVAVYDEPADLLARYDDSPFGRGGA